MISWVGVVAGEARAGAGPKKWRTGGRARTPAHRSAEECCAILRANAKLYADADVRRRRRGAWLPWGERRWGAPSWREVIAYQRESSAGARELVGVGGGVWSAAELAQTTAYLATWEDSASGRCYFLAQGAHTLPMRLASASPARGAVGRAPSWSARASAGDLAAA